MNRIVIASNNPGKLRELSALFAPLGISAVPQGELGVAEAEEPHDTFLENALAKARHASRATGLPALADDSGLCVPSLGGEPGVHSAYYAGAAGERPERLPAGVLMVPPERREAQADIVGRLAWRDYQAGRRDDLWKLAPVYLRPSYAEEKARL